MSGVYSGTAGSAGTNGTSGSPNGTAGGAGGYALADVLQRNSSTSSGYEAVAKASGGAGGAGGSGGSGGSVGGNAGAGGAGGNAVAHAAAPTNTIVASRATALGGNGGNAGKPGTGSSRNGNGNNGGAGGTAEARSFTLKSGYFAPGSYAYALGGKGGSGYGAGYSGGAGGLAMSSSAGSYYNAFPAIQLKQYGGAGGNGYGGASGGGGANSNITNGIKFQGDTVRIAAGQFARGGNGGNGAAGGLAGNANSTFSLSGAAYVYGRSYATGGSGGSGSAGAGASGGTAYANIHLGAKYKLHAQSSATGGNGGASSGTLSGGVGGFASSYAYSVAQSVQTGGYSTAVAAAAGGAGGSTGLGVGGAGGGANAKAVATTKDIFTPEYAHAQATGGNGGSGNQGGAGGAAANSSAYAYGAYVHVVVTQTGGRGGNGATGGTGASSSLSNGASVKTGSGGSSKYYAHLYQTATGGAGGYGRAGGGGAGGSGYAALNDTAKEISTATLNAVDTATGGVGGLGYEGGSGGGGGGATARTTLVGTGALAATAIATGGAGGNGQGAGGGGGGATAAAAAQSTTTLLQNVSAYATAVGGGSGTSYVSTPGPAGGAASATASATEKDTTSGSERAFARAYATGGNGSNGGLSNGGFSKGVGGAGGQATGSTAFAAGFNAHAVVTQTGGSGGSGYGGSSAGQGAGSTLTNAASGASYGGYLTLAQTAIAGAGGYGHTINGGAGGTASSSLTFDDTSAPIAASILTGSSTATGGAGGGSISGSSGGAGTATITLRAANTVAATAAASGGSASRGGTSGNAIATAAATTTLGSTAATATADATASGTGSNTATASAATAGRISSVEVSDTAAATGTRTLSTTATAGIDAAPGGFTGTSYSAYAFATGLPGATNAAAAMSQDPNVKAALGTAQASVLGDATAGAYATVSVSNDYTSSITWTIDSQGLTGDLVAGLLGVQSFGAGFSQLSFTATVGGVTEASQTFTTLAAAQTYFTDSVVNFGAVPQSAALAVTLNLDLTTSTAGNGFGYDVLLGTTSTPCYCRGTRILTDRGEVAVETLAIGDRLVTHSGAVRPIKWIGRRAYAGRFVAGRRDVLPVRIRAGALDDGVPRRDLWVSPLHAMLLDGVLIPAGCLVNDLSITQPEEVEQVEYFHLELDTHDVILAEGAASETFVDDDSRGMFHNAAEYRALYPDAQAHPALFCAPRVEDGAALEVVRRRLAGRAGRLRGHLDFASRTDLRGWAWNPADPDAAVTLRVLADGAMIGTINADRYRGDLQRAGIGDGCHSFAWTLPERLTPGRHVMRVQRAADGQDLNGSPWTLEAESDGATPPPPALPAGGGWLDAVTREHIAGWASDAAAPQTPVALLVFDDDQPIGRVLANRYRPDLAAAGIGRGYHGFEWPIPGGLSPLVRHVIAARRDSDGSELPGSPHVIEAADNFDPALQQAVSRAIDALQPDATQDHVLSFMLAQTERLLQQRADAQGQRAARHRLHQFRRRWGHAAAAEAAEHTAPRALVIDLDMPQAARDAGSQAILSHMAALQSLGYAVSFSAAEAMDAAASADLAALGVAVCGAPFYATVEDVLRRQAGCFDVVYLHRVQIAARYLALAREYLPRARLLYSVADLHHVRLARQAVAEDRPELAALGQRMRVAEITAAWSADAVLTHSPVEAAVLRAAVPQAAVHVVPWAVAPRPVAVPFAQRRGVAFVGSYTHAPNVDAARFLVESVMPLVWAEDPTIPCLLAGSGMGEEIRRLAGPRVVVLGEVADLGREVFDRARLTAAPLRFGAGVKGKVLDSFAAGLPCVMSDLAAEGLDLPASLNDLVGRDAAALAARIGRQHADASANAAASRRGVDFIRAGFAAPGVAAALRRAIGVCHDPAAPAQAQAG